MNTLSIERCEELRREWTDRFVKVVDGRPELKRFEGLVGRVITVNYNGKALIDFADGGWYDVMCDAQYLTPVTAEDAKGKYDPKANSAQPIPDKQG
jgi:hypothetical protein